MLITTHIELRTQNHYGKIKFEYVSAKEKCIFGVSSRACLFG